MKKLKRLIDKITTRKEDVRVFYNSEYKQVKRKDIVKEMILQL
ncbi:hypothetical protein PV797_04530 [Clostridiaceae bacterium M8S5]|nr:hypothetical protein PV797_04530 [Clostridiaceae bacterium M8S5]